MHIICRISATAACVREWFSANLATNDQEGRATQSSAARANLCRSAGDLRMFFLIHQRVVNFLRRRVNKDFVFDVLGFHVR